MKFGIPELKTGQIELGRMAHTAMANRGLKTVAAPGFEAPGVLVYYSPPGAENQHMMQRFKDQGVQIAMGVPWMIDEPQMPMKTFRLGLFGLDKIGDKEECVQGLENALDKVLQASDYSVPEAA